MYSTIINGIDIQKEYEAYTEEREISPPQIQKTEATVPGRNGKLDYTDAIAGYTTYDNRTIKIVVCIHKAKKTELETIRDRLYSLLHGRNITIGFSDRTGVYKGRAAVEIEEDGLRYKRLTVTVDAYPYRIVGDVGISVTATEQGIEQDITINMPVIPLFESQSEITITHNDKTYTKNAGAYKIDELVLTPGLNKLKIKGTGTVKIKYEEGRL